jgi:hypothetical protein
MTHSILERTARAALAPWFPLWLISCGGVTAPAMDAGVADTAPDGTPDASPCTPGPCILLSDDFSRATLDPAVWGVATKGGATVTLNNGILSIRLPAVVDAWAEVFSHATFPVGTTFEASVTFGGGQFYDHKGVGFSSSRITTGCDAGESDAVMFRGQDDDAYIETKTAHVATCSLTTDTYPAGQRTLRITRLADQVMFRHNGTQYPAITTRLPTAPLPVRFSAYTYTNNMPAQPVQIDIDWVLVTSP